MKKSSIVRLCLLLLLVSALLAACESRGNKEVAAAHNHGQKQQYTCPMHPQIIQDGPGKCPICGMDLVPKQAAMNEMNIDSSLADLLKPVNEQVVATTPTLIPESGTRIFSLPVQGVITYDTRGQRGIASRVSGRIERLYIRYNYQPVRKGQLIMEVYSPDLAAAQRELLYLAKRGDNNNMLPKAKQRLSLLGMQTAQIEQVLRSGQILYRVPVYSSVSGYILDKTAASVPEVTAPAGVSGRSDAGMGGMGSGGDAMGTSGSSAGSASSSRTSAVNSPILVREGQYVSAGQFLFTVYSNERLVAEFSFDPSLAAQIKRGQKLVFRKLSDPQMVYTGSIGLIQPTFRQGSSFTIARVYLADDRFQVGQLVTAHIPIVSRGWWVPQSAVLKLGTRSVVFKKEGNVFVPKDVSAGITVEGMVQIKEGVVGWEIARNAAYLVDSESFIRTNDANQTEE